MQYYNLNNSILPLRHVIQQGFGKTYPFLSLQSSVKRHQLLHRSRLFIVSSIPKHTLGTQSDAVIQRLSLLPLKNRCGLSSHAYEKRCSTDTTLSDSVSERRSFQDVVSVYGRAMRFHTLTPVVMFCYPAMWSTFMALPPAFGIEEVKKMGLMCLGAFFARTAGCCVNDMADRNIDKHVERTKTRPLAAGLLSTKEAVALLAINASLALAVLLQFDLITIRLGIVTAIGACCYPFMKRFTNYPQLFLGLASNIGVFMAWSAIAQSFTLSPVYLYFACSLWTVIYDTVYAHQDKKFDKLIGVKSLALYWGDNTKKYCHVAAVGMSLLIAAAGYDANLDGYFYSLLALSQFWMHRKIGLVDLNDAGSCFTFFKRSVVYGAMVLGAIIAGKDISFKT